MEENIINHPNGTIIMNGGNPLEGCPKSWDEARLIEKKLNEDQDGSMRPEWKFDCGFKLDYDGGVLNVSSRFYPPKTHYGNTWDGDVSVYILGNEVERKAFDCPTLEQLKTEVDTYIKSIVERLHSIFPLSIK